MTPLAQGAVTLTLFLVGKAQSQIWQAVRWVTVHQYPCAKISITSVQAGIWISANV